MFYYNNSLYKILEMGAEHQPLLQFTYATHVIKNRVMNKLNDFFSIAASI